MFPRAEQDVQVMVVERRDEHLDPDLPQPQREFLDENTAQLPRHVHRVALH